MPAQQRLGLHQQQGVAPAAEGGADSGSEDVEHGPGFRPDLTNLQDLFLLEFSTILRWTGKVATTTKTTVKDLARDPEYGKPGDDYSVVRGTPEPSLGTGAPDESQLQLYELSSTQHPGTFNLAQGNESNYLTCELCVLVFEDINADGIPRRQN